MNELEVSGGLALGILVLRQVAEVIHKTIPDHATGWKAWVRNVAGVLALYVKNRP